MTRWFSFILWTAVFAVVLIGTFDGTRRVVVHGKRPKEILVVLGLILVNCFLGAAYYSLHLKTSQIVEDTRKTPYNELPLNWGSDTTAVAREEASRSYASGAYLGQGILLKYYDNTGQLVLFRPSQQEISEREKAVVVYTELERQAHDFANIAWTWWFSCLIAVALGWLEGRRVRSVPANSAVETDARTSGARGSP